MLGSLETHGDQNGENQDTSELLKEILVVSVKWPHIPNSDSEKKIKNE